MAKDPNGVRIVGPADFVRLRRWSQRKPAVALMGEFSAGKSTLLNFLIEEDLLPTRATATELPPVWFSHGKGGSYYVDAGGNRVPLPDNDLDKVDRKARFIRLFVEAEILEHCDVIDTPGISDPNLAVETWRIAAGFANMVLWCTSATQAWRQTEFSAWTSLPERLRKHSLLVVTRADKLTTPADKEKVSRRMQRETSQLFNATVFMSTPNAVLAKAELANGVETPMWEESGAGPLLDNLVSRLEGIYQDKAAMFGRYALAEGESLEAYETEDETRERLAAPPPEVAAPEPEPEPEPEPVEEAPVGVVPRRPPGRDEARRPATPAPDPVVAAPEPVEDEVPAPEPEEAAPATVSERPDQDTALAEALGAGPRAAEPVEEPAEEPVAVAAPEPEPQPEPAPEPEPETAVEPEVAEALPEVEPEPEREPEIETAVADVAEPDVAEPEVAELEVAEVEEEDAAPVVPQPTGQVPQQVQLWREIATRFPENPSGQQIVAMIDELLNTLGGGLSDSGVTASEGSAAASDPDGAKPEAGEGKGGEVSSGAWRRLA